MAMRIAVLSSFLFPALLWAQDFQFVLEPDSIPATINGWQPHSPWAGGDAETAPEFKDIDADGDLDCFIGNYWGKITQFLNQGSSDTADFEYVTRDFAGVNLGGEVYVGRTDPVFVDIDADGDLDLFTSCARGLVHFWSNQGTAQSAQFVWVTDSLEYIDVPGPAHLDLVDLDGDADFDLLIGDNTGQIWYYQNIGTSSAFDFALVTSSLGSIVVGSKASPCFVDIDADGDLDLFVGNGEGNIWYYRNDADSANYSFTFVSDYYDSIDVGAYASPEFADIDGDGDYDLIVGREPATFTGTLGDVFFYENIGTPTAPQFRLINQNYLSLDVGFAAYNPNLVDLTGDGLPDLVVGATNELDYFVNIGSSTQPSFVLSQEGFQGINRAVIKPCLGDLDGDGDYDMLAGEGVIPGPPTVALYLNQGTPQNPQLVLYDANFVTNPDFFVNSNPGLADIDADGDYDLFITDDDGHFFYYQNNGTPQWPNFGLVTSGWQGIQFSYPNSGWRGFGFGDLDEDDDLDLLMSEHHAYENDGNLLFYRNMGTPQSASMSLITHSFLQDTVHQACPSFVDIDLDGDIDLFCGEVNGGIMFFRNLTDTTSVVLPPVQRHPRAGLQISLGPNPANPFVVASFELRVASIMSLDVFDLLGRRVAELASGFHLPGEYRYVWDASKNASGVYIIRLETSQESLSEKLMIIK